jgi:hypothetical protein
MYVLLVALGGIFPILLIGLLFGRLFLKNMDGGRKILLSTAVAYVISLGLSGFGNANGGDFSPMYVEYFVSSIMVIVLRYVVYAIRKDKVTDAEETQ